VERHGIRMRWPNRRTRMQLPKLRMPPRRHVHFWLNANIERQGRRTGPASSRSEKLPPEMPQHQDSRLREGPLGPETEAKAFDSAAHFLAPGEAAPDLQTVWRWTQSPADSYLREIPHIWEIYSELRCPPYTVSPSWLSANARK